MIHVLLAPAEVRRADALQGEPQQQLTAAVWDDYRGFARRASAAVGSPDRGWPFSVGNIRETFGLERAA